MKITAVALALLLSATARADELADANKLYEAKAYAEALPLYTRLATAGDALAQLRLGEMAWYGEGGPANPAKAEAWLKKAAAAGNALAAEHLALLPRRALRRADIDYWISKYDGNELRFGRFACAQPTIPAISKQNDDIARVSKTIAAWEACYNRFIESLQAVLPPGKSIPAEVARLMSPDEHAQTIAHLNEVYLAVNGEAKTTAAIILADKAEWLRATEAYVNEVNRQAKERAGK